MQRRSCGSVQIFWLDRDRRLGDLRREARQLLRRDRCVEAVLLFGSLARGEAVPGSDADLLIVLRETDRARWFDRISEYDRAFSGPVDLFPYTWGEIEQALGQPGLLRTALGACVVLAGRRVARERLRTLRSGRGRSAGGGKVG